MSFVEDCLVQLAGQSVGGSNLYSYVPGNADGIGEVSASDYFSQSRFYGQDGWAGGFVFCTISDGTYILQISQSGVTGNSINAISPALSVQITDLVTNVRNFISINMLADDFTMSEEASKYPVLIVTNAGDGTKTLKYPTGSFNSRPAVVLIVSFLTNGFSVQNESGGGTAYVDAGCLVRTSPIIGSNITNLDNYSNPLIRGGRNGVTSTASAAYTIEETSKGKTLIGTNAALQTFTISPDINTDNFTCDVFATGAAGISVVGGAGVTVTGNTTAAVNVRRTIVRDDRTQNYYCL